MYKGKLAASNRLEVPVELCSEVETEDGLAIEITVPLLGKRQKEVKSFIVQPEQVYYLSETKNLIDCNNSNKYIKCYNYIIENNKKTPVKDSMVQLTVEDIIQQMKLYEFQRDFKI